MKTVTAVGSMDALRDVLRSRTPLDLEEGSDVVILPTAAAFSGAEAAALQLADLFEGQGAKVEAIMNVSRDSSDEPHFAQRVRDADLVVIGDGSALHAKSVWLGTSVGEAIRESRNVAVVGSVASVLGEVMVDPRGGAPTNGLGYVSGLVIGVSASEEQLRRTRLLLGEGSTFSVLGPDGVIHYDGARWRFVRGHVATTRGAELVEL